MMSRTLLFAATALMTLAVACDSKDTADTAEADTDADTDTDTDTDADADADLSVSYAWAGDNLEITVAGGAAGYSVGLAGHAWTGEMCGDGTDPEAYGYAYCHPLAAAGTLVLAGGAPADDVDEGSTTLYQASKHATISVHVEDSAGSVACAADEGDVWGDCP